MHIDLLTQIL